MGTVTVLAMIVLAVGYRYHLRLEHLLQTTESARYAETQERRRAENFLYFHRMALAEREWTANNIDRVERLLEDCPPSLRGWEWHYLKASVPSLPAFLEPRLTFTAALGRSLAFATARTAAFLPPRARTERSGSGTRSTGQALRLLGKHNTTLSLWLSSPAAICLPREATKEIS